MAAIPVRRQRRFTSSSRAPSSDFRARVSAPGETRFVWAKHKTLLPGYESHISIDAPCERRIGKGKFVNTLLRRSVIGAIAGAVSSAALVATGEHPVINF